MVQVGLAESLPREITVGGTTGQAETIRDGPGPGRCRGYLITLICYHRVLGMLSELATGLYALTATRDNGLWGPRRRQFLPKALSEVPVQQCGTETSRYPPDEVRLGPSSQRAGVLGVIGRRSPSHRV